MAVDSQSWVLRNDGRIFNDNKELFKLTNEPQEGDVIGIAFDHIDLMFYINNKSIEHSITNIKGNEIFPVVYVDEGAILDVSFTTFQYDIIATPKSDCTHSQSIIQITYYLLYNFIFMYHNVNGCY